MAIWQYGNELLHAAYAHNVYCNIAIENNRVEGPEGPAHRHSSSAAMGRDGPAKGSGIPVAALTHVTSPSSSSSSTSVYGNLRAREAASAPITQSVAYPAGRPRSSPGVTCP